MKLKPFNPRVASMPERELTVYEKLVMRSPGYAVFGLPRPEQDRRQAGIMPHARRRSDK